MCTCCTCNLCKGACGDLIRRLLAKLCLIREEIAAAATRAGLYDDPSSDYAAMQRQYFKLLNQAAAAFLKELLAVPDPLRRSFSYFTALVFPHPSSSSPLPPSFRPAPPLPLPRDARKCLRTVSRLVCTPCLHGLPGTLARDARNCLFVMSKTACTALRQGAEGFVS